MTYQAFEALDQIRIGTEAPSVILTLARTISALKTFYFTLYLPQLTLEERRATELGGSPEATVLDFLHHDGEVNETWEVLATDLTERLLFDKIANHRTRALAINSRCMTKSGSVKYLPMIDFKSPSSTNNLQLIKAFLERIKLKGILLESGQSYHFYGVELIEPDEWITVMGNCLLAPYTDSRWIGHALIARTNTLRISALPPLKASTPRVRAKLI